MEKLSDQDVVEIRAALAAGCTQRELADEFDVSRTHIWRIGSRRARRGVLGPPVPQARRLDDEEREEIVRLCRRGVSVRSIAASYNISRAAVYYWARRVTEQEPGSNQAGTEVIPPTLRSQR